VARRNLPGTTVQAPVLSQAQVQRVWQQMQQARHAWMQLDVSERAKRLAAVSEHLREEGPGEDASRLAHSTGLSTAGMAAAWDVSLAPWSRRAFDALLHSERWGEDALSDAGRVPQRLLHVVSGNVLAPIWSLLMRSWLLGAATWLRPAAREPLFAAVAVRRAAHHEPVLQGMTAVTWWPHGEAVLDPMARAVCESSQRVTLHGSDASIASFRRQLQDCDPEPALVGFGSRWSAVFLGRQGLSRRTASTVARDVALFDQQGCLSPTSVFAPPGDALDTWCQWLAEALEEQERRIPRGEPGPRARASLRHWVETMRLQQILGNVRSLWGGEPTTPWSVVLTRTLQDGPNPLDRSVVVQPVHDIDDWMRVFAAARSHLQGVAVDPLPEQDPWLQEIIDVLQPTLVCATGQLQEPPPTWWQDHRAPLRSLLVDVRGG
jgi:hypothetical protein